MISSKDITLFLHSKLLARLALAGCVIATVIAWAHGDVLVISGNKGLGFPSPNEWFGIRTSWSLAVNLAVICVLTVAIEFTLKIFNVFRSVTALPPTLAAVFMCATPSLNGQLYGGTLMALVLWCLTALMFSTYGAPVGMQRRVFLIFSLLSLGALCQYAFALYMPLFIIGTVQMRIFNLRTLLAAVIGVVTPLWIVLGFGILSLSDLALPPFVSVFSTFDTGDTVVTLVTIVLTAVISLVAIGLNILKYIAYNARVRGFNGMLTMLTLWTIMLICVDFTNALTYQPLLATLTGCQLGHYFSLHRQGRTYIIILAIIVLYIGLYTWNVLF